MVTEGIGLDNQTRASETVISVEQAEFLSRSARLTVSPWAPAPCFCLHCFFGGGVSARRALISSLYLLDEIRHNSGHL